MSAGEHYATTETVQANFSVFFGDRRVAGSREAVELREYYDGRALPPVYYFAPDMLDGLEARTSEHTTFCPIKGHTRYWHWGDADNVIWSYPDPLEGVAAIRGHIAFDTSGGFRIDRAET